MVDLRSLFVVLFLVLAAILIVVSLIRYAANRTGTVEATIALASAVVAVALEAGPKLAI